MFEQSNLLFLYCMTPVHLGASQATGVIDNPIQRERHTNHPNMAGSGIKGALRHHLTGVDDFPVDDIFGPESNSSDYAGAISFGDAQLLAFPVRSLKQAWVYAVSPVTLARLKRLAETVGMTVGWSVPEVAATQASVVDGRVLNNDKLVLEAFEYTASTSDALKNIADWIATNALPEDKAHTYFREKIKTDLVLLPDADFSHFVENATVVEPHVRINNETGAAEKGGLFYTENLPPESLMIAPVFASQVRKKNTLKEAKAVMQELTKALDSTLVQIGGDATTGRGQVTLHFAYNDNQATGE